MERLGEAIDKDAALAIAKEAGFEVSESDIEQLKTELTEEELQSLVAGKKKSAAPTFWGRFKENLTNFIENK